VTAKLTTPQERDTNFAEALCRSEATRLYNLATYDYIINHIGVPEPSLETFRQALDDHYKGIDLMAMIERLDGHTKASTSLPFERSATLGRDNEPFPLYAEKIMSDAGIQVGSLESIEQRANAAIAICYGGAGRQTLTAV